MTPIIIPIQNTKVVDCIVQDGVRYCEKTDITTHEGGLIALGLVVMFLWIAMWIWIGIKVEEYTNSFYALPIALFGGIMLPILVFGLLAI